ncbi:hypothetical protein OSTOST_14228, partial [Ostertagia ostertagi]
VNVIQSGSPGSKPTVLIRGIPSFSGTDPVVIIDGVPQTLTDFNSISAADIESINVLKDAATTAIYGVKGGNGVIVVTTKSGRKNQRPEISVNSNYGIQEVMNTIGVLNATEYAAIINEGSTVAGGNVIFPDISKLGVGTDWQKEIFEKAPLQSHSISARGGSDRMSYFLSAGYLSQSGIVGGYDKSRYNRGTFTANLNFDLTSRLKFILNTTGVMLNGRGVQENSFNSIIGSALNFDPTVPVYNTVAGTPGQYGFSNLLLSEIFNPLTKLENTYNKNVGTKLYGKFELQYDVLKDLKVTSRFGYTKYDNNSRSFSPLVFYGTNNVENSMNADGSAVAGKHNSVSHDKNSNFNYTWETFANYNFKVANDHHFETKKVNGLLFTPSASLYLGTVPIPTANIGSTKSSGIDVMLSYNEKIGRDFKLNTSVTFTTSTNEVTATNSDGTAKIFGGGYFNGQSQTVTVFEKGFAPGYFYGYKTDGLFQNTDEISKAAVQDGAQPGDIRFVDVNKDGVISALDKTKIGDPFPDFTMGWNLNLEYKNFDFNAFAYASVGNDIYSAYERNANYSNKFRGVLGRWTGPGTTNDATHP